MKPLTLIGILLIRTGIAIDVLFMVLPAVLPIESTPFLKNTLQTALCQPGDSLTAAYSDYEGGQSINLSCNTGDSQTYDVGGKGVLFGIVGLVAFGLVGLMLVVVPGAPKVKVPAGS